VQGNRSQGVGCGSESKTRMTAALATNGRSPFPSFVPNALCLAGLGHVAKVGSQLLSARTGKRNHRQAVEGVHALA
jgi:hypothetical protein